MGLRPAPGLLLSCGLRRGFCGRGGLLEKRELRLGLGQQDFGFGHGGPGLLHRNGADRLGRLQLHRLALQLPAALPSPEYQRQHLYSLAKAGE